ncbi:MerR family transcriptional regulator [Kovacikia minuta CCNUW1]|uniref:MerR family transcriptional regulator n=1 Tax=Kovacikia minuta TaxID=2931930 RepID=UPI001CCEBB4E|nr:MerR family transcriptional regulator [Kovacikia minuta]UBF24766.1 MerR family transcriptional regulator [Kovacikia minuta CCNUW1]
MFKIGDFSRLSRVSIRTLRLYDEMDLLKPVCVDQFTGYRYYSASQLAQLNRIVALKDLGFSLKQIAKLLDEKIPPTQIRGMLRLKQAELQHQVELEQARLARVEARLSQIEYEDFVSKYDIVLKKSESQTVAAMRDILPTCDRIAQLHSELENYLSAQSITIVGFPQTIWHDAEYRRQDVDAEAVVPINQSLTTTERFRTYQLPEIGQMACVIHHGSYDSIFQAFNALSQWIEANHFLIVGPNREVYLHPQALEAKVSQVVRTVVNNRSDSVVEVQFPVIPEHAQA